MDLKKNNKRKKEKRFDYYLNLPWTYIIEQAKDEKGNKIYIVKINELPGVTTDALTIQEALESIKEAMLLAFEMYDESGEEIPEPIDETSYKGNIAYRTTPTRHHLIAKKAQKNRLSLSRVIDDLIDSALGSKK
jgi:predicted RNase H-like HicB family nuclease